MNDSGKQRRTWISPRGYNYEPAGTEAAEGPAGEKDISLREKGWIVINRKGSYFSAETFLLDGTSELNITDFALRMISEGIPGRTGMMISSKDEILYLSLSDIAGGYLYTRRLTGIKRQYSLTGSASAW